ncbi:PDC sensor domain-containing protein [Anoxybacillus sp. TBDG-1]
MFLLRRRVKIEKENEMQSNVVLGQIEVAADQLKAVVEQMKLAAESLNQTSSATQQSTVQLIDRLGKTVIYTTQVEEKMKMKDIYLNEFLWMNENIEAVWSNRIDGTFIYSNPSAGLVNAKARPWFVEATKGNVYVSSVYTSALTKRPCLTISAPIVQEGDVIGVVGIDLSV